ncbi:primosome assembly protein PriA [Nostocoides sp. F2B08]|uniref:primosomal protein N' family DNA-binding protein n=1 Tax=Nostocoides sp. F2B08 TaxID=2653936 RepID=UPI001263E611|nr:primosome assembly protein PriA [Tetrasphaera sp. F2B08]KAB7744592.1 primosome assembly protein PriA [Tetrasphaera sp. F2B08]
MSVAAVLVDTGLAHLDRPFEYAVPQDLLALVAPGARVKVRFAGRDLDGFVTALRDEPEHPGRLQPIRRLVSPERVLTPDVLAAAERVALDHAGVVGDVLRLAVPPRHARAERALPASGEPPPPPPMVDRPTAWARYPAGAALLRRLAAREAPAAVWGAAPTTEPAVDWPAAMAEAAAATLAGGRGSILLVPDHRDVGRVDAAVSASMGAGRHVVLTADQGPQARYAAFLKVLRGHVGVVIGTRAAAWAPVRELGLIAWWDDGDDLWQEPRAPYPHVRDVVSVRAEIEGAALVTGGFARSVALQAWVDAGKAKEILLPRAQVRGSVPRVVIAGEDYEREADPVLARARIPSSAWRTARRALESGPVLIQVPRRGYAPSLACTHCRRRARCRRCGGALGMTQRDTTLVCRLCHTRDGEYRCPQCNGRTVRALVVGTRRTAEELARAFPGVPVHTSGAGAVLGEVSPGPSIVISTPGAEPLAEGGYAAAILLDAWALLDRPSIDASVEAFRRWAAAAALVQGPATGGTVVLCGVPAHADVPAVEALSRWDAPWLAARELRDRRELHLPPSTVMALVTGGRRAVEAVAVGDLPEAVTVLGPEPAATVVTGGDWRLILRTPEAGAEALARHLQAVRRTDAAKKTEDPVSIRMRVPDPTV